MVSGEVAAQFNDPCHPVRRLCGELSHLFKVAPHPLLVISNYINALPIFACNMQKFVADGP